MVVGVVGDGGMVGGVGVGRPCSMAREPQMDDGGGGARGLGAQP